MDKKITVKFNGGREGTSSLAVALIPLSGVRADIGDYQLHRDGSLGTT